MKILELCLPYTTNYLKFRKITITPSGKFTCLRAVRKATVT